MHPLRGGPAEGGSRMCRLDTKGDIYSASTHKEPAIAARDQTQEAADQAQSNQVKQKSPKEWRCVSRAEKKVS